MKENPGQFKRNQEIRTLIVSKDYKELSKYLSKNFEKLSIKKESFWLRPISIYESTNLQKIYTLKYAVKMRTQIVITSSERANITKTT